MNAENNAWKWTAWFLGVAVPLRLYFVQELFAAWLLFALGFAAITSVILGLYVLQKGWEMAVTRIFGSEHLAERGLPAALFDWMDKPGTVKESCRRS